MPSPKLIYAHGKTYDISELIRKHPGGENCLIKKVGKDCSTDYNFHSNEGKDEWVKYEIKKKKENNCCVIS
jgi:cytochrome b involved in lipid metabolism